MRTVCVLLLLGFLAGCRSPYDDLEASFRKEPSISTPPIKNHSIVLISKRHEGAFNYPKGVEIRLAKDRIEITPNRAFHEPISLPASAVSACGAGGWGNGDWDNLVLIDAVGTQLIVQGGSSEITDWCWENRLPIASTEEIGAWQYRDAKLPARESIRKELSSREAYDEQIRQSRLGF